MLQCMCGEAVTGNSNFPRGTGHIRSQVEDPRKKAHLPNTPGQSRPGQSVGVQSKACDVRHGERGVRAACGMFKRASWPLNGYLAIGHPSFQCLEPGTGLRNLKKGGPQRPWHMDKLQVFKRKVTVEKGQWRKLWRWPSAVTS